MSIQLLRHRNPIIMPPPSTRSVSQQLVPAGKAPVLGVTSTEPVFLLCPLPRTWPASLSSLPEFSADHESILGRILACQTPPRQTHVDSTPSAVHPRSRLLECVPATAPRTCFRPPAHHADTASTISNCVRP